MFITLFLIALFAQLGLLALFIVVPNFFIMLHFACHGSARRLEKKYVSSKQFILTRKMAAFLVSILDSFAYLNALNVDFFAKILHSYEVVGLENIPSNRPVLLIYYHGGPMPSDMQYLPIRVFLKTGRVCRTVADQFFFVVPSIWTHIVHDFIFPGTAEKCMATLKKGHTLQIAPGGAREAFFATRRYEVLWKNRCGFARVAKEAGVDIIPVFTRNIRQMFVIPRTIQYILRPIYEKIRGHLMVYFGGFPVKLTTYVGKPIKFDSVETAEELAELTRKSIEEMIQKHQTFPADISSALRERIYGQEKVPNRVKTCKNGKRSIPNQEKSDKSVCCI